MQTIETTYLGPTNTKPSRIRAQCANGHKIIISRDQELSIEGAHARAADALRAKMGWPAMFLAGSTARGFIFAFPPESEHCDGQVWIGR